jgi:hypothetical protein
MFRQGVFIPPKLLMDAMKFQEFFPRLVKSPLPEIPKHAKRQAIFDKNQNQKESMDIVCHVLQNNPFAFHIHHEKEDSICFSISLIRYFSKEASTAFVCMQAK